MFPQKGERTEKNSFADLRFEGHLTFAFANGYTIIFDHERGFAVTMNNEGVEKVTLETQRYSTKPDHFKDFGAFLFGAPHECAKTVAGAIEIGRVPGVVMVTFRCPVEKLEKAGLLTLVKQQYGL